LTSSFSAVVYFEYYVLLSLVFHLT